MNKLEQLEYITGKLKGEGYEGTDVDLTTSLGEYNIIVKPVDSGKERTYKALYQTHYNEVEYYCTRCFPPLWIGDLINNHVNDGFLDWIGTDLEPWSRSPVVVILYDLMQYYGHLNIFGDPYNAKTLKKLYSEVVKNE